MSTIDVSSSPKALRADVDWTMAGNDSKLVEDLATSKESKLQYFSDY